MHGDRGGGGAGKERKAGENHKEFRGKKLRILVENPDGRESGCTSLTVNGTPMEGNYVPEDSLTAQTEIVLTL